MEAYSCRQFLSYCPAISIRVGQIALIWLEETMVVIGSLGVTGYCHFLITL